MEGRRGEGATHLYRDGAGCDTAHKEASVDTRRPCKAQGGNDLPPAMCERICDHTVSHLVNAHNHGPVLVGELLEPSRNVEQHVRPRCRLVIGEICAEEGGDGVDDNKPRPATASQEQMDEADRCNKN